MRYDYIFGPVVSGRLGRSLGLDLLGAKICSFDCLYCEVGPSRRTHVLRKPYVPAGDILEELARWKDEDMVELDHVTLGGSGEPCLNTDMGDIIRGARALFPGVRIAVLTNASLLHVPEVARDLAMADAVLPSLDSAVESEYQRINQPHPSLALSTIMDALLAFRTRYDGILALEVLLARGINDSRENLDRLGGYVAGLAPDRVDVATLSRPGAYPEARGVDKGTLERWSRILNQACGCGQGKTETGGSSRSLAAGSATSDRLKESLTASLSRRPQTAEQLSLALGADRSLVDAALDELASCGIVIREVLETEDDRQVFFRTA